MNFERRRRTELGAVRLVGGHVGAAQATLPRIRLAVAGARSIDWSLAHLGLAKPVALISGFWRSGTTWIQECLAESIGAKTVFEPLSPLDSARRLGFAEHTLDGEDNIQAFFPSKLQIHDPLWGLLDRAFTGRHGSKFLLSSRRNIFESFRRQIVVKDVRLQFNLAAIHERFAIPVIHVRRHPCAVVASLLSADWHWSFEHVLLSKILPDAARDMPDDCDRDALSRIVACWAITERHVAHMIQDQLWARIVTYEDVVENPTTVFDDLCHWIGRRNIGTAVFDRPSASVHPDALLTPSHMHHDRWRRSLPLADIGRIEQIADRLHPAWRDAWT